MRRACQQMSAWSLPNLFVSAAYIVTRRLPCQTLMLLERAVHGAAVLWRLRALVQAVVADHARDAQAVILENHRPTLALGLAVTRHIAPCGDRLFIAPERE